MTFPTGLGVQGQFAAQVEAGYHTLALISMAAGDGFHTEIDPPEVWARRMERELAGSLLAPPDALARMISAIAAGSCMLPEYDEGADAWSWQLLERRWWWR